VTWKKDAEARRRDNATYGAEYRHNRELARRRAGGVCEGCQHRHTRLECDHIVAAADGGGHSLANLRMLCGPAPGGCGCHAKRTAQQGGGYRTTINRNTDPEPRPRTHWTD
jgi:hypothetical protein